MLSTSQKKIILGISSSLALVTLSFGLFSPNTYFDKEKANDYFRQGVELYNSYQYQASTDFFINSLSSNPDYHEARKRLGQAYYFAGDVSAAIQEWNAIFRNGGEDPTLKLHIQNLNIINKKHELSENFVFFNKMASKRGFRYQFPSFIYILPNQNILILAKDKLDNGILLELSPNGKFIHNMRRISSKLELPMAATVDDGEIWVTDYGSDTLHRMKWSKAGKKIPLVFSMSSLGSTGSGKMQFRGPAGICYYQGFYFVVDNGNHRIHKIARNGKFNLMFHETEGNDSLEKPFGIACHKNGKIYVSEVDRARISVFDAYGNFEEYIGNDFLKKPRHIQLNPKQTHLVIADEYEGVFILNLEKKDYKKIKKYNRRDGDIDTLVKTYSATLDKDQNLFITDYSSHSILHFLPQDHLIKNVELWVERIDNKQFPTVALWVSVQDHTNSYITKLQQSNFKIIENGSTISGLRVVPESESKSKIVATVLLSRNTKMKKYSPNSSLWALDFTMKQLRKHDRLKLISYAQDYRDETPWTNSRLRLRQGIREAGHLSESDQEDQFMVGNALYYAASELLPKRGNKAIIWMHEGEFENHEFNSTNFQKISNYLKINHIRLYVISFENPTIINVKYKKKLLKEFAEYTGGGYYHAYSSTLEDIDSTIRAQERENMLLYYKSEANKKWKNQYMDLKIMVNFQGRVGAETTGYFVP